MVLAQGVNKGTCNGFFKQGRARRKLNSIGSMSTDMMGDSVTRGDAR